MASRGQKIPNEVAKAGNNEAVATSYINQCSTESIGGTGVIYLLLPARTGNLFAGSAGVDL